MKAYLFIYLLESNSKKGRELWYSPVGSQVQDQPRLSSEFKVSLNFIVRSCFKTTATIKKPQ
jgi:hypothetical protein